MFSPEQLNLDEGIKQIIELNRLMKNELSNLVSIFETSPGKARSMSEEFKENEEVEINVLIPEKSESQSVDVSKFLKDLNNLELHESMNYIEKVNHLVSYKGIVLLKFAAYVKHGYKEEALNILKDNYDNLDKPFILMFGDLLNNKEHYTESYNILSEIYVSDKWLHGLTSSLVVASRFLINEKRKSLIQEILSMNVKDPFILQECANFYNETKDFENSGKLFRQIYIITQDKHFEIEAKIAEIQDNPPTSGHDAEAYLKAVTIDYPKLENEVLYRCALMWKFMYDSIYMYYSNMDEIKLKHTFKYSYEVVRGKLEILSDLGKVEKALRLKPLKKDRDNEKLLSLRSEVIIKELEYLFLQDNGHILLTNFINNSQSDKVWHKSLAKELKKEIDRWNEENIEGLNESIDVYPEEELDEVNSINAIRVLRERKHNFSPKKELDEVIKGAIIASQLEKNKVNELWIRYESATWYSLSGYYQDANNQALTLLNFYNRVEDEDVKNLSFALGIVAWGDSHFRLGKIIEGVICVLVAVRKGIQLKNYYIIDKALNIIYLWINNHNVLSLEDKKKVNLFYKKVKDIANQESPIENIQSLISEGRWEEVYEVLKPFVLNSKPKETEWAIHFANYISACIKSGKQDEAFKLVMEKSQMATELLKPRVDIRWKIILMWSQILLYNKEDEYLLDVLLLNRTLLKIAVEDIEKQRSNISHKEERAYISDQTNELYRTYVETLCILYKSKESSDQIKYECEKEGINFLIKIAPRTIAEQRLYENSKIYGDDEKFNNYISLYDELMRTNSEIESDDYKKKTYRFSLLQEELLEQHPYLKPLPVIESTDLDGIQKQLRVGEIYYQYCLTPMGMVYLLITEGHKEFGHAFLDPDKLKKTSNYLGDLLSKSKDKDNVNEAESLSDEISNCLFHPLITEKNIDNITNLYICPDMSVPYFSSSLIRKDGKWLINSLDAIYNLVSVSDLLKGPGEKDGGDKNKNIIAIGSSGKGDKAIPIAERWLRGNKSLFEEIVYDFGQENLLIKNTLQNIEHRLFTIVAHGVSETDVTDNNGAYFVLGPKKQYLTMDDIQDISLYSNTLFFITCKGGQPYSESIQSGNSVWGKIVSQKSNTILCRWDVDIRPSLNLLEHLLTTEQQSIPRLLLEAQKKLLNSKEWYYPSAWACYEYWGI
ncbi:hypothetical protein [Salipaludibacillus sp. CF4.18]|uniref:hypothetical protein n=1 Tax=Salipaludibacillus sp. CF4.18 TaxID=3373081 RepID=UPI003EE69C19